MHPHEYILLASHIALDDGQMAFAVQFALIGLDAEMTELAREVHIGYHVHEILRTLAVFDECLDRDHVQAMLLGKLQQFRRTHHMSIIIHDLTAETSRIETCQPGEIRRRLRMASPAQYAALDRTQ